MMPMIWKNKRVITVAVTILLLMLILFVRVAAEPAGLKDFVSDGCSLFPDKSVINRGDWCDCCFRHDIAYWQGGTRKQREIADRNLEQCVYIATGDRLQASMMYAGVSIGGDPVFPTWYRWAYGWPYNRGYKPLSSKEQLLVIKKLKKYRSSKPVAVCK